MTISTTNQATSACCRIVNAMIKGAIYLGKLATDFIGAGRSTLYPNFENWRMKMENSSPPVTQMFTSFISNYISSSEQRIIYLKNKTTYLNNEIIKLN